VERQRQAHEPHRRRADARGRARRPRARRAPRGPRVRARAHEPHAPRARHRPAGDEDLREFDYGEYEGLTTPEIREQRPGWYLWSDGNPGGETADQVGARADRVIERALAALSEGDVVAFAHGHLLRVLGARWIELGAECGGLLGLDTAALCELGFERENRVIWLWNG
jgi:broad specificity phosphatase PhoE